MTIVWTHEVDALLLATILRTHPVTIDYDGLVEKLKTSGNVSVANVTKSALQNRMHKISSSKVHALALGDSTDGTSPRGTPAVKTKPKPKVMAARPAFKKGVARPVKKAAPKPREELVTEDEASSEEGTMVLPERGRKRFRDGSSPPVKPDEAEPKVKEEPQDGREPERKKSKG